MRLTLRKHQRETVEVCREILNGRPVREIIMPVTPGGGKSFVPVILAENLIPAIAEKICWVVPRNSLKYQGEGEFCDPRWGTAKRIRAACNGEDLTRGLAGYVTTYQAVGQNPECHAAEFRRRKYILILDEFHHVAEGSEWHKALAPLVKSAVLVILASGTLSRGDGERIAFLGYAGGGPFLGELTTRRVITYSRGEAIADGAILPVRFNLVDGDSEWEEADGRRNTSKLSGEESAKALFTALRTEFANGLMDMSLREYRLHLDEGWGAKMLVVAPNIKIAKAYYDYLKIKGYSSRIATSEDTPAAKRDIKDFKKGAFNILVSVAMASEGLNVPNVSVICFLTNIRSVPWIEQCVARANRIAPGKREAVVYAPADWAFKKAVRMIEAEQLTPLNNPEGQEELFTGGGQEEREGGGGERPWIIPVSSRADSGGAIPEAGLSPDAPPCPPSEAEKILRKNINWAVTLFLNRQRPGNRLAQSKMLYRRMKLVAARPLREMNLQELQAVWLWLKKEYGGIG